MCNEHIQGDEWGTYVALARSAPPERGIAYGARALWGRSPRSSRRRHDRPRSTGKPCTGRRGTGDQTHPIGEAREMRSAETVLGVRRERGRRPWSPVARATRHCTANGQGNAMFRHRSLESCLRSKDSRAVWRGAVGKGPQGTSLAAYPTSRPVLRRGGGRNPASLAGDGKAVHRGPTTPGRREAGFPARRGYGSV